MGDLTISGLDDVLAALAGTTEKLAKGAIRAGAREGTKVIQAQAKANFNGAGGPTDLTGALKASIRVVERRGTPDSVVFNVVAGVDPKKFGANSAYYALWVEKGHINRKMHDALFGSRQFKAYQRQVSTSNTPAHPFMRPAIEQKAQEAIDVMARTIVERFAGDVS